MAIERKWLKRQGLFFEKYMVSRLSRHNELIRWTSDKYCGKIFALDSLNPDLGLRMRTDDKDSETVFDGEQFAVECKWHCLSKKAWQVRVAEDEMQLYRYRCYGTHYQIPVFIAIGLGRRGCDIGRLFIVPVGSCETPVVDFDFLERFEVDTSVKAPLIFNGQKIALAE